jgi:hypothetical protein
MDNKELIEKFYIAFQNLDYKTMVLCYSADAVFSDPIFGLLQNGAPQKMWEMLCKRAKDFSLTFDTIILIDNEYATCNWIASYTFAATGKKVINKVKAYIRIKDGLIIEHTDSFNFYVWAKQAIGIKGFLLGRTSFFQRKIKMKALVGLQEFMDNQISKKG